MGEHELTRRSVMVAPVLLAAIAGCGKAGNSNIGPLGIAHAAPPDPLETFVLPYDKIVFEPWGNLPPGSGQMAMLYGDFNKPGPYLVMMKWNPGWFSAPHAYATDRICVVVSGTWWVNSGAIPAERRRARWGGRICEAHCPHTALRWGFARPR
jgi:hypothetical protein